MLLFVENSDSRVLHEITRYVPLGHLLETASGIWRSYFSSMQGSKNSSATGLRELFGSAVAACLRAEHAQAGEREQARNGMDFLEVP